MKLQCPKCPRQWKHINIDGSTTYILQNTPTKALEKRFTFGQVVEMLGIVQRIVGTVGA